jgi:hypothetical protein
VPVAKATNAKRGAPVAVEDLSDDEAVGADEDDDD